MNVRFYHIARLKLICSIKVFDSCLEVLGFVESQTSTVVDGGVIGFLIYSLGQVANGFLVQIYLQVGFASLNQELLVVGVFLQCDVGVKQRLLILFISEIRLTDPIIDSNVLGSQFQGVEEVFDCLCCLPQIVFGQPLVEVYIRIVVF